MRSKKYLTFTLIVLIVLMPFLQGCTQSIPEETYHTSSEGVFSYDNATFYFAMTDRFYDGNPSNNDSYNRMPVDSHGQSIATFNGGDFEGLTHKINTGYFNDLGVDVLWISAPYEQVHGYIGGGRNGDFAHYGFHGYYALDWTMVDRNFGTVESFRTFVDSAHRQGIRVVLDVVMNHVGYPNVQDMLDYNYGGLSQALSNPHPEENETFHKWTQYVNWQQEDAWKNWWGDWVRSDLPGYIKPGEGVYDMNLMGLPDIRTEVTEDIGLPPILINKWASEDAAFDDWIVPAAKGLRSDLGLAPADYIIKWLASWVEEFGIDGFRIDTAKHVEIERWEQLKVATNEALHRFRANNPDNPAAAFNDDFYFVGEVWGQGVQKNHYYDRGFDALINFAFQGERRDGPAFSPDRMPRIFENYADAINSDPSFNVLSYISQHDTTLYPRNRLIDGGSFLMLLPGMIKIFYGDETAREMGDGGSDGTMGTRSFMNWEDIDTEVLSHFQKLGTFRRRNISIGAGDHVTLSQEPFIFYRHYDDDLLKNTTLVYMGPSGEVTLDVTAIFDDSAILRDAYTMTVYNVKSSTVTILVDEQGIALLEEVFVDNE